MTDEDAPFAPVRVVTVHRDALEVAGPAFDGRLASPSAGDADAATVGDWLLIDPHTRRIERFLERRTVFKRKGAGTQHRVQLIAANVDTLLLITSANQDFNLARLERYLALALDAEVTPVLVITKADLVDATPFIARARRSMPALAVKAVDAREPEEATRLAPWFGRGQTVALLGSSGVGKSTLLNTLAGRALQSTQATRSDDDRGRHTTTARSLHRLPGGAWMLDTPGMRELQLFDVADGIDEVFADLASLAAACRFSDCTHAAEPGCAIRTAMESGAIDAERLSRYEKLRREEARNSETIAEARARAKAFGRMARQVMERKRKQREW